MPQRVLRVARQPRQLPGQEFDDVVGVLFGVDATEVEGPSRLLMVEGQQTLVGEYVKKLDHEKRIAVGLRVHQLRERGGLLRVDAERVGDKPAQIFGRKRAELDVLHPSAGANRLQLAA